MATIYSGPGKVYLGSGVALQAEGVNGTIELTINEESSDYATAMFGRVGELLIDQTATVSLTPFDDWSLLPTFFPTYVGATTGSGTGYGSAALKIGTRPHAGTVGASSHCKVWTPDGRLYDLVRYAVTGHPTLTLAPDKALFGRVTITCLGDPSKNMGESAYLFASITESGATDPGGAMSMSNFVREHWVGEWESVSGFDAVEAEDGWTIEPSISYSPLKVSGRTLALKLDSVAFMARCVPVGPTHSQILSVISGDGHAHGKRLTTSSDLVLTSALSGKTITLHNAQLKGAGFRFGGTTLGTDEIGFVTEMQFSAGVPSALVTFSA